MNSRALIYASGTSTGFSLVACWEFARRVDWQSAVPLLGSIISTAVGIYMSRRAEITKAETEERRQIRQEQRDSVQADLLAELRLKLRQTAGQSPPPAALPPDRPDPD